MTAPLIDVPAIREEGFEAMSIGFEARHWAPEYRAGFCSVPYAPGTTERANFMVGACAAVFGALH